MRTARAVWASRSRTGTWELAVAAYFSVLARIAIAGESAMLVNPWRQYTLFPVPSDRRHLRRHRHRMGASPLVYDWANSRASRRKA